MRYIKDIPHPTFRIGLYSWNGKFIVKIEVAQYEQTYKISEMDVASEADVLDLLDEPFLQKVADRFRQMHEDFSGTLARHDML